MREAISMRRVVANKGDLKEEAYIIPINHYSAGDTLINISGTTTATAVTDNNTS
jgi:hypothetical protein